MTHRRTERMLAPACEARDMRDMNEGGEAGFSPDLFLSPWSAALAS
jgi:hypothetical protein